MTVYDDAFYRERDRSTRHAATQILKPLIETLKPRCLVDVGCGVGTWLDVARQSGVEDVRGFEGTWLDANLLVVERDCVTLCDLEQPLPLGPRADLVLCLEVAEHLSANRAQSLVRELASLAGTVVFGAAVPFQGGDGHVNEQWQSWWAALFRAEGLDAYDCIRPAIWEDDKIPFWYRQNTLVYSRVGAMSEFGPPASVLDLVHPEMWQSRVAAPPPGLKRSARLFAQALGRRLSRP